MFEVICTYLAQFLVRRMGGDQLPELGEGAADVLLTPALPGVCESLFWRLMMISAFFGRIVSQQEMAILTILHEEGVVLGVLMAAVVGADGEEILV